MRGFEPLTSSLPRKRSTPELHRLIRFRQTKPELRRLVVTEIQKRSPVANDFVTQSPVEFTYRANPYFIKSG